MITVQSSSSLFNLPDLVIGLFLLLSIAGGAHRGLIGTVIGMFGRIAVVLGANWLAGMGAPMLAQTITAPLTAKLFQSGVIQDGMLSEQTAAQVATSMARGVSYFILVIIFFILLSIVLSCITHSINLLTRFPPLGVLNRMAGAAVGCIGGVLIIMLALWIAHLLRPEIFTSIGWLSPSRIEQTVILNSLLTYFPIL